MLVRFHSDSYDPVSDLNILQLMVAAQTRGRLRLPGIEAEGHVNAPQVILRKGDGVNMNPDLVLRGVGDHTAIHGADRGARLENTIAMRCLDHLLTTNIVGDVAVAAATPLVGVAVIAHMGEGGQVSILTPRNLYN